MIATTLRGACFLARHELLRMFRLREVWLWAFAMPLVFMYFMGAVMGRSSVVQDTGDPLAVFAPPDAGFLAGELIRRVENRGYRVVRVPEAGQLNAHDRRLMIPPRFTESVLAGRPVRITFSRAGAGPSADHDKVRLARAVYSIIADLIVVSRAGAAPGENVFRKLEAAPRAITLDVRPAGNRRAAPTGFEQSVPGCMTMFALLVMFTSGGVTLLIDRENGILRRLASSPMPRAAVVLGKWTSRMALGGLQVAFSMAAATLLFGVRWGEHLPTVVAVLLTYAGLATSLGMLLGNFGRTHGQVVGIGVVAANVMAALGGCMWPVEVVPEWARHIAMALPTGWTMDAMHRLMSFGDPPVAVLPHLAALAAAALAASWFLVRHFRWE